MPLNISILKQESNLFMWLNSNQHTKVLVLIQVLVFNYLCGLCKTKNIFTWAVKYNGFAHLQYIPDRLQCLLNDCRNTRPVQNLSWLNKLIRNSSPNKQQDWLRLELHKQKQQAILTVKHKGISGNNKKRTANSHWFVKVHPAWTVVDLSLHGTHSGFHFYYWEDVGK